MFVLKGIAEIDGKSTAFVEDATSKQVMPLTADSALPIGRVKSVDIDSIQFEPAGAVARRIAVGQNFAGQVVPPTPPPAPPPVPPGPPGPGAPGNGPPGGPGGPMPPGAKGRPPRGAAPGQEVEAAPAAAPNQ